MLYLIYEKATGVVVSCVDAAAKPSVMAHHNTIEYSGTVPPALDTVRVKLDGSAVEPVVLSIETVRARALAAVDKKKDTVQCEGCSTTKGMLQSDPVSRDFLLGAAQMAQSVISDNRTFSMPWRMQDNSTVMLTAAELVRGWITMASFISTAHLAAAGLKDKIIAAKTVAEINAINIDGAAWHGEPVVKTTPASNINLNLTVKL